MGLNIHVDTDIDELIDELERGDDFCNRYWLSRRFCNLMLREFTANGMSELSQLEEISRVDISAIQEMQSYWSEYMIEEHLSEAGEEFKRKNFLKHVEKDNALVTGNIERVLKTLDALIKKLSTIKKLEALIDDNGGDTLDYTFYFSNFNSENPKSYVNNNFGQDLKNFQRYIELAKSMGAKTVWFRTG